jgi:hypothetical protein
MASETIAKRVFKEARRLYEAGFKSANKNYDAAHASWWKRLTGKAERRNRMQAIADPVLGALRDDSPAGILPAGKYLYDSQVPAANCGDLACLCCYLAYREGVAADHLAAVVVYTRKAHANQKGADHMFAMYGEPADLEFLRTVRGGLKLSDIDGATAFRGRVFAIDPWANLVCPLDKYPSKAADKMRSWSSYGKRVLWIHLDGITDAEWCQPGGEYLTVFSAANLRVSICQPLA